MRVLINAASAHMGGAFTYVRNVLSWLPRVAADDTFTLIVPRETRDKLGELTSAQNVEVEAYPYGRTSGPERLYFDQVLLPRRCRAEGVDVLFSSTGFGTFASTCPEVLLVRNLAYFDPAFQEKYRELGRSLLKNTLRRWHSLLSIRRADVVLFPTAGMQAMVERHIDLDGKPTRALHYGFDHDAFARTGSASFADADRVDRWRAEGYRVLLNVSTYAVHKNFETLVEALAELRRRGERVKLLTTTSRGRTTDTQEYDRLLARAEELGVRDDWVELGYVPYEQLGGLYERADAYVFPSFSESFGHSLVEAMAAGLPVVAAGMSVNREVCGDAALYFDTYDAAGAADAVARVLRDDDLRTSLAESSRRRANDFSWRDYTTRLVGIFRDLSAAR